MLRRFLTILSLTTLSIGILLGQAFYGSIVGNVNDSSSAALPSTTVALTNNSTGDRRTLSRSSNERVSMSVSNFNLEFRSEVFNMFNCVQFGQPNRVATTSPTSTFGQITSQINDPRLIQLALRLRY